MRNNFNNWKSYKISKILSILNGSGITTEEIEENPGNLNAIQSGEENNGCLGKIDLDYCKSKKYTYVLKPCLTVARSGSAGFVSYQRDGCVVGDSAKILLLPDDIAKEERYLFIQTVLTANRFKYTYGRKVTEDKYMNDYISLPSKNIDGVDSPDWIYIDKFIHSLHYKPLTTKKTKATTTVDTSKWKEFTIGNIFEKPNVIKYSSIPENEGQIPFISSTSDNNGIAKYIDDESNCVNGNCITVSTNGDCFDVFYQPKKFVVSTDVDVLINNKLNKYNAMFICSVLRLEKPKWSYGRKPKNNKVYQTIIKLPAKKIKGKYEPDWKSMEKYIKSLPYGDRI